jgi:Zn-dependent M28 family amino/carboxypeptidase
LRKEEDLVEGATLSQRMIDGLADAAATYSDLVVKVALDPRDSDHVSFIDAGLPAVSTIQGGDVSNGRIYTVSVTLDHINTDLSLRILLMNVDLSARDLGNSDQHSVRLRRGCSDRVTQRQAAFIQ